MVWEQFASRNKGELVAYALELSPTVKACAIFYGPDAAWYASLTVRDMRIGGYRKALNEADAKKRAIELAKSFVQDLTQALLMIEGVSA